MDKLTSKIYYNLPSQLQKNYIKHSKIINFIIILFLIIVIGIILFFTFFNKKETIENKTRISPEKGGFEAAVINYSKEVEKYAEEFDLPSSYLMALIMLECSGKKNIKPRYERSVFRKLKQLKAKKIDKLEVLTYEDVKDANDKALINLASSWGPFQLMGYKCVGLNININKLRGENRVYWAIKWIDMEYGDYLRNKQFKDAFHLHNTGQLYPKTGKPKTYDPKYVQKGLKYMKYFEQLKNETNAE